MTQCRKKGGFIWADEPESFLNFAREKGWRFALESVQAENSPDKLQEALAPNRLAWLNLIDIKSTTRAMDIGAGSGGLACQLAKKCKVSAIDTSKLDVEFLKIRAEQDKLKDFEAIVASATKLPFEKESFDLVTMNGVLEWVALGTSGDPRKAQIKAIKEVRRVLAQDGKFLLGIENRNYIMHYFGLPEPHVGLNYISLLDYSQAGQLSQAVRGLSFQERTYTEAECRELISLAGFTRVETYWMYPNYRLPEYLVPLDDGGNALSFFVSSLLKPQDFSGEAKYAEYMFYKFSDPKIIKNYVGHLGFMCC